MKEFLSQTGVPFVTRRVSRDPEALAEFRLLGFPLPPVTVVDGTAVPGYQPDRIAQLLEDRDGE